MERNIKLLDNDTINKIAAGEVIENPRSIVKELVENSIDAGADEIIIEVKNGGKSLIRITDNGKGIERDEIEDAFKRHCTSKIENAVDLSSLHTLGFRGEALASIAAVSKVEIITRTSGEQYGIKAVLEGGEITLREDIGCPQGTTVTVTELFYNVPARKKFLKSDMAENGSINESVTALALCQEGISFKYINNGHIAFKTPKTSDFINTISSLYERDLYNSLIRVDYSGTRVRVTGYTSDLNYYRGNRKVQLVFVNGRVIKHKRINYFIEAAYYTLLPKNKYPACFLKIETDPSYVDVNVHPAKTEVRFQNEEVVLNEVKNAIYRALRSNDIIKEIKKETITKEDVKPAVESIFEVPESPVNRVVHEKDAADIDVLPHRTSGPIYDVGNEENEYKSCSVYEDTEVNYSAGNTASSILNNTENKTAETDVYETVQQNGTQQSFMEVHEVCQNHERIPELSIKGTLFDTYIICESISTSEMYMIDQHAAHERINYEKFLAQYNSRQILTQEMLVPEVINLSYDDYYKVIGNKDIFISLGISVESFGINSVIVTGIPLLFCNANIKNLFMTVLDTIKDVKKTDASLGIGKIIKNACVKSVKAGDRLHIGEAERLIEDLVKTENPYTCPHGRPVIIKMTKYEIERMFERIQI